MYKPSLGAWLALAAASLSWPIGVAAGDAAAAQTRQFTVVSVEVDGTKFWLPSTLVVDQGDTVKIKLLNKVPTDPNQHGYAIPDYGIAEVVTRGEPKDIEFTADKPGIFPINCQLHPPHIGGQLIVR
jgi:plastocyanin domain-containing protein